MDDAPFVRGVERFADLHRDTQRSLDGERTPLEQGRKIVAVDELHDERSDTIDVFDTVDMCNVGMIDCRQQLGFAIEPADAFRIDRKTGWQDFDRDVTIQPTIARAIDLAHSPGAKCRHDLIVADPCPRVWCHRAEPIIRAAF
jgi:hypothetical protein